MIYWKVKNKTYTKFMIDSRNINFTFKSEGIGSGYQMGTTFVLAEIDDGRP